MRLLLIIIIAAVSFHFVERLCKLATDGFSIVKISEHLPQNELFSPPSLSIEDEELVKSILSQPFYYLTSGGQAYVFISNDGNHVLKFFKFHRLRLSFILKNSPLIGSSKKNRDLKKIRKEFKLQQLLTSITLSYNNFKKESGLIYHHLNKTSDLKQKMIIFDKVGCKYQLEADDYIFILQKAGTPSSVYLKKLVSENQLEEAHKKIHELIQFSISRAKKGIHDDDFMFKSNLGFINGEVAQLDLGSLLIKPSEKEAHVYIKEIEIAVEKFKKQLNTDCPILIDYLDEELDLLHRGNPSLYN